MDYYKLLYDYENDTNAGFIRINESTLGFSRYSVNETQPLGVDGISCEVEQENIGKYDYIANNLAWLIVSERIKVLLDGSNLGEYEFIQVRESNYHETVGYLMHSMNLLDALDESKSVIIKKKYTIDETDYEHLSVLKYAIKTDKIGSLDIFKLKKSNIPYFISESLKERLTIIGAKGFDFLKIKTT
ncbi:MAG: imm11 family protein [Ignavibacteriales bacterium]